MSTFVKYRQGRLYQRWPRATATAQYPKLEGRRLRAVPDRLQLFQADRRRDPGPARRVANHDAMQARIDNYPDSEYVDDAQAKIRFARDQLAGKEMQIGRYYMERKEYLLPPSRASGIAAEKYPNTNQIEEALARLVEAYYARWVSRKRPTAAASSCRNYPDSQWYGSLSKLLKSNGAEPRENQARGFRKPARNSLGT